MKHAASETMRMSSLRLQRSMKRESAWTWKRRRRIIGGQRFLDDLLVSSALQGFYESGGGRFLPGPSTASDYASDPCYGSSSVGALLHLSDIRVRQLGRIARFPLQGWLLRAPAFMFAADLGRLTGVRGATLAARGPVQMEPLHGILFVAASATVVAIGWSGVFPTFFDTNDSRQVLDEARRTMAEVAPLHADDRLIAETTFNHGGQIGIGRSCVINCRDAGA